MMEGQLLVDQLLRLQDADRWLARLARRHYALLQGRDRNRNMRQVAQQRGREQLSEMRSTQEHLSDLAWELEDLEVRLRDLVAQEPGSGDHLLDREVASLRRRHAELEQRVIELMLQSDELARQIPDSRAELDQRVERHARREVRLNALIARVEGRIAEHDQRRRQIAALLPPDLLAAYEELRPSTANQPLASFIDGHCGACGACLSAFEAPVSRCQSCGRLVVRKEATPLE